MSRRRTKAILVCIIMLACLTGLAAQPAQLYKYTKDLAEHHLRELFPILQDAKPFLKEEPEEHGVWGYLWGIIVDGEPIMITTEMDAQTGRVMLYEYPDSYDALRGYANATSMLAEDEVTAIARSTIHAVDTTILPGQLEEYAYSTHKSVPLFGAVRHERAYTIVHHDASSPQETIYVQVDRSGTVVRYERSSLDREYAQQESDTSGDGIPSDSEGHWAEEALQAMAKHEVMFMTEEDEIHPNTEVTAALWQLYVYRALYGDNTLTSEEGLREEEQFWGPSRKMMEAAEYAAFHGWYAEGAPAPDSDDVLVSGETMTREQWAGMLAAMIDPDKLSKQVDNVDLDTLVDVDQMQDKQSIAAVLGTGLLTAADGRFYPADPVTKAQAATVLVRLSDLHRSAAGGIINSKAQSEVKVTTPAMSEAGTAQDYITLVHKESSQAIHVGMLEEDLVTLLGRPTTIDTDSFDDMSIYTFGRGLSAAVRDEEVVWLDVPDNGTDYVTKIGNIGPGDKLVDLERAFGFKAESGSGPFMQQYTFMLYVDGDRIIPSSPWDPNGSAMLPYYWIDVYVDEEGVIERILLTTDKVVGPPMEEEEE